MNLEKIREACAKRKLPVAHLAKQIGLSKTGLYLAIDRNTLQAKHLEDISKILNVPIWEFFDLDPSSELSKMKDTIETQKAMIDFLSHKEEELMKLLQEGFRLRDILIKNQKEFIESIYPDYH